MPIATRLWGVLTALLLCIVCMVCIGHAHGATLECRLAEQEHIAQSQAIADLETKLAALGSWQSRTPDYSYPVSQLIPDYLIQYDALQNLQQQNRAPAATDPFGCSKLDNDISVLYQKHLELHKNLNQQYQIWANKPINHRKALYQIMSARQSLALATIELKKALDIDEQHEPLLLAMLSLSQAQKDDLYKLQKHLNAGTATLSKQEQQEIISIWLDSFSQLEQQSQTLPSQALSDVQLAAWQQYWSSWETLQRAIQYQLSNIRSELLSMTGMTSAWALHRNHTVDNVIARELELSRGNAAEVIYQLKLALFNNNQLDNSQRTKRYQQLFIACFAILIFVAAVRSTRLIKRGLLALREKLFEHHKHSHSLTALSRILTTFSSIFPWLVLWLAMDYLAAEFATARYQIMLWLIPPAKLYIVYRLVSEIAEWLILRITLGAGNYLSGDKYQDAVQHADKQTSLAILPWLIIYLFESLIGITLITIWLIPVAWCVFYICICRLVAPFKNDIIENARRSMPTSTDSFLHRLSESNLTFLINPLLLPLVILGFVRADLDRLLADFDWYRKLNARLFRLRSKPTEESENDSYAEIKNEKYEAWFLNPASLDKKEPFIDTGLLEAIYKPLKSWINDHEEYNTLLLQGERGIGKTTALGRLVKQIEKDAVETESLNIKQVKIPKGYYQPERIQSIFEAQLSVDLTEGPHALVHEDKERTPTIILVDDAENLFLSSVGGLDGWRYFLSLTNLRLENIFWVVSINSQSFAYLSNVFGHEYQFANTVYAKRWNQNHIRSLILARNHIGGIKIDYDEVLLANRGPEAGNLRNAEQRYFDLLWDSCRGNPSVALQLWLQSIKVKRNVAEAGPPPMSTGHGISKLGRDLQFVYAAIIIHESLSSFELARATSLPTNIVRYAIKSGLEAGFLERLESGYYSVCIDAYLAVTSHLARKNMLHE